MVDYVFDGHFFFFISGWCVVKVFDHGCWRFQTSVSLSSVIITMILIVYELGFDYVE